MFFQLSCYHSSVYSQIVCPLLKHKQATLTACRWFRLSWRCPVLSIQGFGAPGSIYSKQVRVFVSDWSWNQAGLVDAVSREIVTSIQLMWFVFSLNLSDLWSRFRIFKTTMFSLKTFINLIKWQKSKIFDPSSNNLKHPSAVLFWARSRSVYSHGLNLNRKH